MPGAKRNSGWIGVLFVVLVFTVYRAAQQLWPFDGNMETLSETTFKLYPDFGIEVPDNFAIHGIDVSRYQGQINWGLVQAMKSRDVKIGFAIIKATEGERLVDAKFARNWRKCKESGIPRGAYHFFRAHLNAASQARSFIKTVDLRPGDLPPVLDIETLNNTSTQVMQDKIAEWLLLIEQHYKIKPIIYTNAAFYNQHLHPRFSNYPVWVAHYKEKNKPRIYNNWIIWQHSESGRVNGINHFVDFNVFNGDSTDFRKLLMK
jgi:lysozyme